MPSRSVGYGPARAAGTKWRSTSLQMSVVACASSSTIYIDHPSSASFRLELDSQPSHQRYLHDSSSQQHDCPRDRRTRPIVRGPGTAQTTRSFFPETWLSSSAPAHRPSWPLAFRSVFSTIRTRHSWPVRAESKLDHARWRAIPSPRLRPAVP